MNRRTEWVAVVLVYTFIAYKVLDYSIEQALVNWRNLVPNHH